MVKPQLNLEKKDESKKPDGNLVKVVTITEEPAPLNPEPVYSSPNPRGGGRACKCFSLCFLIGFFFLLTFMCIGYFVHHRYGRSYGWCGVGYYDDWDYAYYDDKGYEEPKYPSYDGPQNGIPYGDDMLIPPRPTGPPLARFLEEDVKIDLSLKFVRISHPVGEMFSDVDVLHDFNVNVSAYLMVSSQECYLRPLNYGSTLNPEQFQDLMETEAFRDQDFPFHSEIFTVDPEKVHNLEELGPSIQGLCDGVDAYYIHSIPQDQWGTFWRTARGVLRDHFGSSSVESSEEGRRHGSGGHGGRHGGRPGGRHGGRHSDDSDSSSSSRDSSEEGYRRQRRSTRLREFMENIRTFDGKSVTDMHVFQSHNLHDLSQENKDKLTEVAGGFMP